MNTDTGRIAILSSEDFERAKKAGDRLVEIDERLMTERQRAKMAVSLHDTTSALGKLLHKERSKYTPHVGLKELSKAERKEEP